MKVILLLLLAGLLVAGCRGSADPDGEAGPGASATASASLFDEVYRSLATLRLLVEDLPPTTQQGEDSARYVAECAEMPGGCNLEAFRLFYANQPDGAALVFDSARRGCARADDEAELPADQQAALSSVCGELPRLVQPSSSFAIDVPALDAAIAALAAVAE